MPINDYFEFHFILTKWCLKINRSALMIENKTNHSKTNHFYQQTCNSKEHRNNMTDRDDENKYTFCVKQRCTRVISLKKSLKISNEHSESVYRRPENTMATPSSTKGQPTVYKAYT